MRRTIVTMSSLDKYTPIRGCLNTATQLPPSAMSGQVSLDLRETDSYALNMSPSMRGPLPPRRCFVFPFSHESGIYYPLMLSLPVSGASPSSCLPTQRPQPTGEWSEGPTCHATSYGLFGCSEERTDRREPKSNDAKWKTFGPYFPTCRSSSLPYEGKLRMRKGPRKTFAYL